MSICAVSMLSVLTETPGITAPMQANILPPTFQASCPPPQGSDTSAPGNVRQMAFTISRLIASPWRQNTEGSSEEPDHRTAGCCARAASGHAATPPSSVMNWRRFIQSPRPLGRGERYPQIFDWLHDPRSYLLFYTLDWMSPLPRSSQETRIPGQRPLVQSPPIPRHPEVLRRHRRASCCPHAIQSVEPYRGHYPHTLCASFPRRQSRGWRTRTQCEPGHVFDF